MSRTSLVASPERAPRSGRESKGARLAALPSWRPAPAGRAARVGAILLAAAALAGCRQDMHQAPRYDPLEKSDFFADGRAARPLVEHTVARGFLREDVALYTGKQPNGAFVETIPVPVDKALLERGQDRYNVYCAPCHGRTGDGNGMIVQRGFKQPTSYHTDRLRAQPVGYFYDVITNGFGAMQDYSAQVAPRDRWAIAAYLRALQFSRNASVADVPAEARGALEAGTPAPSHGGASTHE